MSKEKEVYSPLEDRCIVLVIKSTEPEKTATGIITDMKKKETVRAEVIAIGQGYTARDTGVFVPTVLGEGDIVLIGANGGLPIDIPNEKGENVEHLIMREGDILSLISKKSIE